MEEKAEFKKLLEGEERPYDNNTKARNGTDEPFFDSTVSLLAIYVLCFFLLNF